MTWNLPSSGAPAHTEVAGVDERAVILARDAEAQSNRVQAGIELQGAGVEKIKDDSFVQSGAAAVPTGGRAKLNAELVAPGREGDLTFECKAEPLRAALVVVDQRERKRVRDVDAYVAGDGFE